MSVVAVHLHGRLACFGGPFSLHVGSVAEAVRALCAQLGGLAAALMPGAYRVTRKSRRRGILVGPADLALGLGHAREIHIVPVVEGRGRGAGKAILGVILVAASFFVPGAGLAVPMLGTITAGQVAIFGVSMIFAGIGQLLSPTPKAPKPFAAADSQPSFLFQQPVNVSAQGSVVPLVYGRFRTGTVVVSAALEAEDYSTGQGSVSVPSIGTGKIGILSWANVK